MGRRGVSAPARIRLGLVPQVAALALLAGCGEDAERQEVARCVDARGTVTWDDRCTGSPSDPRSPGPASGASHYWYYGGRGYNMDETASGGSPTPTPGATQITRASPAFGRVASAASSRGGFGSSGIRSSGTGSGASG
jgi:hypothetical protein